MSENQLPKYHDLNLSNIALKEKALALGFNTASTLPVFHVKAVSDIAEAKGQMVSIESQSVDLLRDAMKQLPYCLVNPLSAKNFDREPGLIRDAQGKAAFEIPISALISAASGERSKLIWRTLAFLKACVKLKAEFVFTSRAKTEYDLKSPREIIAIASLLGVTYEQAQYALSATPEEILRRQGLI